MATATLFQAKLATVASFPGNYFLENFALRADQLGFGYSTKSQGTVVCSTNRSR